MCAIVNDEDCVGADCDGATGLGLTVGCTGCAVGTGTVVTVFLDVEVELLCCESNTSWLDVVETTAS